MKKRVLVSLLAMCISAAMLTGCSSMKSSVSRLLNRNSQAESYSDDEQDVEYEEYAAAVSTETEELQEEMVEIIEVSEEASTESAESASTASTDSMSIEISEDDITAEYINSIPGAHMIEEFEVIYQEPELPTGCEITSLTMVLNYYGYDVSKVTMAKEYLPTVSGIGSYYKNGVKYGADMNNYFIGNPAGHGRVCGTGAIVTAANSYLSETGSYLRAKDLRGTEASELYELVKKDIPVVVWVTISMGDRGSVVESWTTEYGEEVDWSQQDHCAVLIGVTEDTVIIADPISGIKQYSKEKFEAAYEVRSYRSVVLE